MTHESLQQTVNFFDNDVEGEREYDSERESES